MFRGRQGSHSAGIVAAFVVMALVVAACGDDDADGPGDTAIATTTQAPGEAATTAQAPAAGGGTATVTVPEGTFELTLDEPCVLSEVGLGVLASGDASLMIAGPAEIAVVVVELQSGDSWSAAAAGMVLEGTTLSYAGPAMGPGGSADISVTVDCGG